MDGMLVAGGSPSLPRRVSIAARWLPTLGIGVAIGLLILGSLAAYSARQDAWGLAERQSQNLLLALKRDIGRNITVFDLSLQGVIDALDDPGIDKISPTIRRHALFDRAASAEDLGSIDILDSSGAVVESSASFPPGLNLSDRDFFAFHREHPDAGLYISRVFLSQVGDREPSISISRRIPTPDGHFAGVVSGALRLRYFQHLFEEIDVGPRGSITLLGTNGRIVWRYPAKDGDIDRDLNGSEALRRMTSTLGGQYVGPSAVDGTTRLFTFGRVDALPLTLSVNFSVDDIYAHWRRKAAIIGPVLVLMCASIVTLSLLFRSEMRRRESAEEALTVAARNLALMAATDALTGLANRRTFEERLDRDRRRALDDREAISVLMVDVDNFKSFNDTYGHQEGDRVLKLVARAIEDTLRRPADLAARYGGEEFIVLLPECGAGDARIIAERVRVAVETLDIPHALSSTERITVSIGVATRSYEADDDAFDLIKASDQALYAAKRSGRNTVRIAASGPVDDAFGSGATLLRA